jgi:hypothetical protein
MHLQSVSGRHRAPGSAATFATPLAFQQIDHLALEVNALRNAIANHHHGRID